jgi:hypothetical protein
VKRNSCPKLLPAMTANPARRQPHTLMRRARKLRAAERSS